ncbi:hypothetical protein EWM64_g8727, partial [Hericium alpestre]
MFSNAITVALFSLSLSAFTAQALPQPNNENCGVRISILIDLMRCFTDALCPCQTQAVSTVFQTVTTTATVTAGASSQTSSSGSSSGNNNSGSSSGSKGSSGSNSGSSSSNKGSVNSTAGNSGSNNVGSNNGSSNNSGSNSGSSNSSGSNSGSSSSNSGGNQGGTGGNNASTSGGNKTSTSGGNNAATSGGSGNNDAAQSSLTLDPAVIAKSFAEDGQQVPTAGQVASLTSSNNFINFCSTVPDKPITNGQQIKSGSCNPAPMGVIASTSNMPSSKFTFPANFGVVPANKEFTISMAINNIETGNFVNPNTNYYSAPQQLNAQGTIIGHTHVVIEKLDSLQQTAPTNPTTFAFFKGVNGAAVNGIVSADVTSGLPAGDYRLASINAAANHQPVLVAVAQHGSLDDMIYFTVSDDASAASNSTASGTNNASAVT